MAACRTGRPASHRTLQLKPVGVLSSFPPVIDRHPSIEPVHPGEILREDVLPALSMSKTALAEALGISRRLKPKNRPNRPQKRALSSRSARNAVLGYGERDERALYVRGLMPR